MKKVINFLFSTRFTAILFFLFAAAMAISTFIENDYGTQSAKALVYNAWWFELIMLLFMANFIGNIKRYRLLRKEKVSVLMFHLAFVLIILGAGITRYVSYEGIMPIYEGETTNKILSDKAYIDIHIDDNQEQKAPMYEHYLFASTYGNSSNFIYNVSRFLNWLRGGNHFSIKTDFKGAPVEINYVNYIPNAFEEFQEDENGQEYLKIVESGGGGRHEHYIRSGQTLNLHNSLFSFENPTEGAINIYTLNDTLRIKAPANGEFMIMASQTKGLVVKDSVQTFNLRSLYQIAGNQFVVPQPAIKGKMALVSGNKDEHPNDMLEVEVVTSKSKQNIKLFGNSLQVSRPQMFSQDGLNFRLRYGSKQFQIPFSVKLRDFQLERYPGSMSPKSYASEITVVDGEDVFDFRIFMNHVLDHKGYRFFQSSYNDQGEVEQTFLSVNYDTAGTWTSYVGYFFLFLGLIFSLLLETTRFGSLRKRLKTLKKKKAKLLMALLLVSSIGFSQNNQSGAETESHDHDHDHEHEHVQEPADEQDTHESHSASSHESHEEQYRIIDSIIEVQTSSREHAREFGKLVIQDEGGRMKPVNTFASELLRKVSKKDSYKDMDANQVMLSMLTNPRAWYFVPFIYIKSENTKVRDLIGIPHDQKYARFSDLFTDRGVYKLTDEVGKAHKKKIKDKYEESILNIDGRANLLFGALGGSIFKFFPLPEDKNNKWFSFIEVRHSGFKGEDSLYVSNILPLYSGEVVEAAKTNDYSRAEEYLNSIHKFQEKYGAKVMPTQRKVELELFYNEYDIFKSLFKYYMYASLLMFIVVIINIFNDKKLIRNLINICTGIILLLFVYHTIGLGIRWYISGHAPWSNGYESMIYVSWATMFFGVIFGKRSPLTLAATTFVTSMLLMVAHWNWMDPSIGNLVPVLDSYWLMVHVAIIVASYGPFTIGMVLGMVALILYIFTTKKNKKKMNLAINEITTINEMSLTIGLVLLTIGNFLGGIWANESWGRYWGWDPKETWALISIMVYAFVLHMRLIPGLKSKYTFNMVAVFAFASILMTYLGVNHLLSGLHSYAAGESAAVPNQIWGWLVISLILSILAYYKFKKYYKKKAKK
ncbi:c-type cytochrome biogenesis protein CcsB [Lutimonas zeaxanthinifaciens]|uniref:c-type cytochrome biogenesis protein CcsB n=1 Tax=Lutimonas zeaxanthinifaciens TaxID=3060215 RepID=UPI00265C97FF|nr:c-type cytochrome biogenesis protein CcsB [Lutimonas sp. YSD2104]WKK67288.1 c-type cytochrome biogenesis protein CcsB [Lutimonas sp. YSD2104]